MAPATTSKATAAQSQQLLDMLSGLTVEEFQRLLSNGDVLKLLAKVQQSEESARAIRQYACGYVSMLSYYSTSSWKDIADHHDSLRRWYVRVGNQYIPMLQHYNLEFLSTSIMLQVIRMHWLDYTKWYVRVA